MARVFANFSAFKLQMAYLLVWLFFVFTDSSQA